MLALVAVLLHLYMCSSEKLIAFLHVLFIGLYVCYGMILPSTTSSPKDTFPLLFLEYFMWISHLLSVLRLPPI